MTVLRSLLASAALRRLCTLAEQGIHRGAAPLALPTALPAMLHALPCFSISRRWASASTPAAAPEDAGELSAAASSSEDQTRTQGLLQDLEVPLYNLNKQQVGSYTLGGDIFDVPIRRDILHRVVRWQQARQQQGTHKVKTRSEVRGGGRKPFAQKGSGRARQGTIRAPQMRGGGIVHGPVPRSHEHSLQKKVRRLGLRCALSAKAWEGRLLVVESLRPENQKTKTMDGHLSALLEGAPRRSVLLVDSGRHGDDGGAELRRAIANLSWADADHPGGLSVLSILRRDYLTMTPAAVEAVTGRLRSPVRPWPPPPPPMPQLLDESVEEEAAHA